MPEMPASRLYVVLDYFDGPIEGVADFQGKPHYFVAEFDEERDSHTTRYQLSPLSAETIRSVLATHRAWIEKQHARRSIDIDNAWRQLQQHRDRLIEHD